MLETEIKGLALTVRQAVVQTNRDGARRRSARLSAHGKKRVEMEVVAGGPY